MLNQLAQAIAAAFDAARPDDSTDAEITVAGSIMKDGKTVGMHLKYEGQYFTMQLASVPPRAGLYCPLNAQDVRELTGARVPESIVSFVYGEVLYVRSADKSTWTVEGR